MKQESICQPNQGIIKGHESYHQNSSKQRRGTDGALRGDGDGVEVALASSL